MNCIQCQIRDICIIYEAANKAIVIAKGIANIQITDCQMCPNTLRQSVMPQQLTQAISPTTGLPVVRRNFKEESIKAQKEIDDKQPTNKITITSDDAEKIIKIYPKCPSCEGKTTEDDIDACSTGCGKLICSNCGTEDPTSGKRFCQECWDKR